MSISTERSGLGNSILAGSKRLCAAFVGKNMLKGRKHLKNCKRWNTRNEVSCDEAGAGTPLPVR